MTASSKKRIATLGAIVIVALALASVITGAIGASMLAGEGEEPNSFLPKPVPHIPPQKIFISSPADDHAPVEEGAEEGHGGGVIEAGDGFVVTNTLLSAWMVTLLLIVLFYFATRKMEMVPRGLQNLMEAGIEALLGFVEGVAGAQNARRFFPIIATIFLFVLFNAWVGLLPIYPALGFFDDHGVLERHLLRPAGTDLNMPLALAIVSFIFIEFWGLRMLGPKYLAKFFPIESIKQGKFGQVLIDAFVGILELLSEFIRVVSFTFRLFGNMTAGEMLLIMITYLLPFVFILPFYGLELLVGVVQALIFSALTLVFVVVAVTPHEAEEHS